MKNIRVIAMYLPQYHRIPENDMWWGEGYTEWTAVRGAEPLFEGHYQPRVPQNNRYYDLLDKSTMAWQADLMHRYDVDGMCFYHYYFGDGRMVLEKPAENLLKWTDIDMPFCFSWANETWARSWSKIETRGNSWNDLKGEKKQGENGLLLYQHYGDEGAWERHFMYLLPFFNDKRYLKHDGKPIFVIYRAHMIPALPGMIQLWQRLAVKNGLKGIYFISTGFDHPSCDATLQGEPDYSMGGIPGDREDLHTVKYKKAVNQSIKNPISEGRRTYFGITTGFDDSPRRGVKAYITYGSSPKIFEKYMKKALKKSDILGNELLFLFAWNEWGESMYLEPDERFGTGYLEAVKTAQKEYGVEKVTIREKKVLHDYSWQDEALRVYNKWMRLLQNGRSIAEYLDKRGIKSVAIYGMGVMGVHLYDELGERYVHYGIDKRGQSVRSLIKTYTLKDDLPEVEAVIICVLHHYKEIYEELRRKLKVSTRVLYLEELIDETIALMYGLDY